MNPKDINWKSEETHFLHNPKLPAKDKENLSRLQQELPDIKSCIWVLTSGSTSLNQYKWVALGKKAFLSSAQAVNEHINSDKNDIWLNALPIFHVGGLSVWARAHLSGAKVVEFEKKWDPHKYIHELENSKISLSSLVPTQLFDLVHSELKCPSALRVLFVGGGVLSEELYKKARALDYPVLPTYGMTELCSQIATASLESLNDHELPNLELLSHLEMQKAEDNILEVKSPSLLTGVAQIEGSSINYTEHDVRSWFSTGDIGDIQSGYVKIRGRKADLIKVSGELVSFPKIRSVLELISIEEESTLISIPDERKGHAVAMVFTGKALNSGYMKILDEYNKRVSAFERATQTYFVESIPKTPLGKIKVSELKEKLGAL